MTYRLIVEDRVVRDRRQPGQHCPKARWVIHDVRCEFAGGCTPLADLVEELGESGIIVRVQRDLIARCVACHPMIVERVSPSS